MGDQEKGQEYQRYLERKWNVQANTFNPTTFMEPDTKHVDAFFIKVSNRRYAHTTGKLRIGVKQGQTSCETIRETFISPDRNGWYEVNRSRHLYKFNDCRYKKFNPNEEIQIRIISDSGDDSYLDKAGIKINGQWKRWIGYHVKINKHGEGRSWR